MSRVRAACGIVRAWTAGGATCAALPAVRALVALSLAISLAMALVPPVHADDALDVRLRHLESGLRCLVCQNQTLAESNADLAADLRREVRELALSGKSDDEIRLYLVARYGDFVLYDPPLKRVTWLLWFGPFVLLAAGVAVWFAVGRIRRAGAPDQATGFEAQARSLLYGRETAGGSELSGDAPREPLDA
ncbi:MAG: cytochrome c-type biogenesis protein [Casimicrobiaceae bacterium]